MCFKSIIYHWFFCPTLIIGYTDAIFWFSMCMLIISPPVRIISLCVTSGGMYSSDCTWNWPKAFWKLYFWCLWDLYEITYIMLHIKNVMSVNHDYWYIDGIFFFLLYWILNKYCLISWKYIRWPSPFT